MQNREKEMQSLNRNDRANPPEPTGDNEIPDTDTDKRQDPGLEQEDGVEAPTKGDPEKAPVKEPPNRKKH